MNFTPCKLLIVLCLLLLQGCKPERLFKDPPHGDSWKSYDNFVECEKNCDILIREKKVTECGCST